MSDEQDTPADTRVTVSLSTLRAELMSLELRLVDRLNTALESKADKEVVDQAAAMQADVLKRVSGLEAMALQVAPLIEQRMMYIGRLENSEKAIDRLQTVAGYKKWLWAQTLALSGIGIAVVGLLLTQGGQP